MTFSCPPRCQIILPYKTESDKAETKRICEYILYLEKVGKQRLKEKNIEATNKAARERFGEEDEEAFASDEVADDASTSDSESKAGSLGECSSRGDGKIMGPSSPCSPTPVKKARDAAARCIRSNAPSPSPTIRRHSMVLRSSKSPSPLPAETPSPDTRLAFFMHTRSFRKTPLPRRKASQKAKSTMLSPVPGAPQCIETTSSPSPAPGYYARKKSQVALMKSWRRRH